MACLSRINFECVDRDQFKKHNGKQNIELEEQLIVKKT